MTEKHQNPGQINRRAFVAELVKSCPDALFIAGLGSSTYDLFAAGDRPSNFYLWGAMGGAAAIGLGLALAQPERDVVVLTGDGEQLMGLGMLATIGAQQPANFTLVILDNGHFGETGMQRSHTSLGTDLIAIAKATSFKHTARITDLGEVGQVREGVSARKGPALFQVMVKAEDLPRALPIRDGVHLKNRFRAELGFAPL